MEIKTGTLLQPEKPARLWSGPFILFLVINIFSATATQMVTPLLPTYLLAMGSSLTLAAGVTSILSIVALVARPFSGAANDFMNRKVLMLVSSLTVGLCVLGYSFSTTVSMIVFFRLLHGLAFCFQGTTTLAFSASFIPRNRFGEGMGYMGMAQIAAFSVGPNVGILLSDKYGTNVCFAVAACISIVASVSLLAVPYKFEKKTYPEGHKFKIRITDLIAKEVLVLALFISIFSIGNGMINTFIKKLADDRLILNVGLYFTANALTMVAVRPFAGRLLDKKGLTIILVPAYMIAAAAMFLIGAAQATWFFIVAGVFKAIGQGSGAPSIQAASIKMLGKERSGVASSTCYIGQDLGNIIGPLVGGVVATRFSIGAAFNDYAVLLMITAVAYFVYSRFVLKRDAMAVEQT